MATGSFDWCCSRAHEITAHLREIAPGMSDDEITWLPPYVQDEARQIRDEASRGLPEPEPDAWSARTGYPTLPTTGNYSAGRD